MSVRTAISGGGARPGGRLRACLLALLAFGSIPSNVFAGPIEPGSPNLAVTFDVNAGQAYSLVVTGPWSLLFDDHALTVAEESAWPLLPGGRDRSEPLGPAFQMAGGRRLPQLDDVRRSVLSHHVWSPAAFLPTPMRTIDWSPLVLSTDAVDGGRAGTIMAFRARLTRGAASGATRLQYLAPAALHVTTLLPTRPGTSTPGRGTGAELDLNVGTLAQLDSPSTIPAPPAAVLTVLGVGGWMLRRLRRR